MLHLPDISANKSVLASCGLSSFATSDLTSFVTSSATCAFPPSCGDLASCGELACVELPCAELPCGKFISLAADRLSAAGSAMDVGAVKNKAAAAKTCQ